MESELEKQSMMESFSARELTLLRNLFNCGTDVIDGLEHAVAHRPGLLERVYAEPPPSYEPTNLERQMHWWFDTARFALKPLRQNENELVVQFHWLRDTHLKLRTAIPLGEARIEDGLLDHESWGPNRGMCQRNSWPLETGQTYIIRSDDPEHHPLPNFRLLELQWNLLRIAAIAGAGEDSDINIEPSEVSSDEEEMLGY